MDDEEEDEITHERRSSAALPTLDIHGSSTCIVREQTVAATERKRKEHRGKKITRRKEGRGKKEEKNSWRSSIFLYILNDRSKSEGLQLDIDTAALRSCFQLRL